jgi:hypothetical protein
LPSNLIKESLCPWVIFKNKTSYWFYDLKNLPKAATTVITAQGELTSI